MDCGGGKADELVGIDQAFRVDLQLLSRLRAHLRSPRDDP